MTPLQTAAQQALEAWDGGDTEWFKRAYTVMDALRAALAEPPVDDPHRDHWVAIAEAAQKIAASKECGLMEAKALCAALDRLTEAMLAESEERNFCPRCGKRVSGIHTCTPPQGEQERFCDTHCTWADHAPGCVRAEPVAWVRALPDGRLDRLSVVAYDDEAEEMLQRSIAGCTLVPLYPAPPQRKPLTEEDISAIDWKAGETLHDFARAVEQAAWEKNNG